MEINSVLEALRPAPEPQVEGDPNQQLDRDIFLRLLITQLQHQDPLNPSASEEMVAELAQFTALEQSEKTAGLMQELLDQGKLGMQLELVGLIGHEVTTVGDIVHLSEEGSTNLAFNLEERANTLRVTVLDNTGRVVRSMVAGFQTEGLHDVAWDGLNNDGDRVESGNYHFKVEALNAEQDPIPVVTFSREKVMSTTIAGGLAELILGSGRSVTSADIITVL